MGSTIATCGRQAASVKTVCVGNAKACCSTRNTLAHDSKPFLSTSGDSSLQA